ncbi:MAG TPA: DUF1080 domain-containing protein [Planctomycetota bacterium]|nr:DUF1080 domain-containing protein [Planctomycetota bacterium]
MNAMRLLLVAALSFSPLIFAAGEGEAITDPAKADADFLVQGEYTGELTRDGNKAKTGVQVIALGGGKFHAVLLPGGLPGDGWEQPKKEECDGATADGVTSFTHANWVAKVKDGVMTVAATGGAELGQLKRIIRESPTLGAKPPAGAVILFDGKNVDEWQKGAKMTEDGLLQQGANSVKKFGSCQLHVEFRTPYKPLARGQGRGNSGVYLQSRYETQVLDSFGLAGKDNETGGIYSIKAPDLNMCFPPLSWQTYDIDFTAAQWEGDKKVKDAMMTVKLNGVVVQKDVALPKITTAAPLKESPEPGPLHLQDHGNPVRYRNIWLLEKK